MCSSDLNIVLVKNECGMVPISWVGNTAWMYPTHI